MSKTETMELTEEDFAPGTIREPQQARSRETMDRILEALEALLAEKSFDKVTMQELAQRSETGISSIYARFKDKQALILGMHARVRERAMGCVDDLSDAERWKGVPLERMVRRVVIAAVRFYRDHGALIRAALFVDDAAVRERQGSVLRMASGRFAQVLTTRFDTAGDRMDSAVDAACRILAAVMYAELMFGDVAMVRNPVSDRVLARQLSRAILALITEAL